jgi:hypothetical protein
MRNSALTSLVIVGLATISHAFEANFLHSILEQSGATLQTVEYNFNNGYSSFNIGSRNNTVYLRPNMNLDLTAVSSRNCSRCPRNNYDVYSSENDQFLKGNMNTESL